MSSRHVATSPHRALARILPPWPLSRLPRWWAEVVLVLVLYAAYDATRGLFHARLRIADQNADLIYRWERAWHLDPEQTLNQALHHLPPLAVAAAYFYVTLHFIVTPAVLVWLYRSHPEIYRRSRTWIVLATVVALLIFWRYPVTPPRLLPGAGIRDTLADVHRWGWWSGHTAAPHGLGSLVNEFAAMPSLHVGWALWSGWLIARHARRPTVRVLGALYPVLTTLVVMSTGNHYFADALAGGLLVVITGGAVVLLENEARPETDEHEAGEPV
jgi:hypothetical protein